MPKISVRAPMFRQMSRLIGVSFSDDLYVDDFRLSLVLSCGLVAVWRFYGDACAAVDI